MDVRDELSELVKQAKEHLLYFHDLGVTHVGEQVAPSIAKAPMQRIELPTAIAVQLEAPAAPQPERTEVEPQEPPALFHSPQSISKTANTMTTNKDDHSTALPSLFGESVEPVVETLSVTETLEDIRRDLGDCKRCKLWSTRTNIVFGEGSSNATLMFVGEAPGADEDASGRPFVGRAGQLLTKMIEAIDLKREDVYIANSLKSRPPGNRNPEADETRACIPFLFRQIATIRPKLIVTLGNPATQGLLETKVGISRLRGTFQEYPRIAGIKVLPTFHPAYLLRSPDKKREAWEDMKKVRAFLRGEIEA